MKKKYRDIFVDNTSYAWTVGERIWPDGQIKIWYKSRGKVPWCELDFDLSMGSFTPKRVEELIIKLKDHPEARECLTDPRATYRANLLDV